MTDPTKDGLVDASLAEQAREETVTRESRAEFRTFLKCVFAGALTVAGMYYLTENAGVSGALGGVVGFGSAAYFLGGSRKIAE